MTLQLFQFIQTQDIISTTTPRATMDDSLKKKFTRGYSLTLFLHRVCHANSCLAQLEIFVRKRNLREAINQSPQYTDNLYMKINFKFALFLLLTFTSIEIFAKNSDKEPEIIFNYPYEYRLISNDIKNVNKPYQKDDYIIFTQEKGPRHIGIAFDFEGYKTIHSYMKKASYDINGKEKDYCYFYILELPQGIEEISYRIIVDGIWATDPTNENKFYNPYTGIEVSKLYVKNNHINETNKTENGVHFIYQGESGKKIRLAGTFTNWDSSIYELKETKYGYYELYLPLPKGTYYYAFYDGTKSFVDKTNSRRAWSKEGRETSMIVVE